MSNDHTRWHRIGGEFLLIVLGVLTALGIEGLASWAVDRRAEADYLTGLSADLSADTALLRQLVDADEGADLAASRLLDRLDRPPDAGEALPEVAMTLVQVSGDRGLPFSTATYDDLISSGNLNLIRDVSLRRSVVAYYRNATVIPAALGQDLNRSDSARRRVADLIPVSVVRELYHGRAPSIEDEAALLEAARSSAAVRTTLERFLKGKISRVALLNGHRADAESLLIDINR